MFLLRPQNAARCRETSGALHSVKLDGREWKYVAEGGANVLFRHHPPATEAGGAAATSDFYGKLLRVKKCDAVEDATHKKLRKKRTKSRTMRTMRSRSGSFGSSDSEDTGAGVTLPAAPYNAHYPHPTKVVAYATKDVLPYLEQQVRGNVYEQVAQLLPVDKRFLMELNEQLLTLDARPEHRRQSQIDVALQSVMVLPDVTLPPPDEDPLLFFDETIDSEEGSESGASSERNPADHDGTTGESSTTDHTVESEDLFDALVEDLEDEMKLTQTVREETADYRTNASPSPTSASSASTVTSGDAEADADVEENEEEEDDDHDADDETDEPLIPSQPRRRRMLSGNCNIFDCCFRNICVEIKPKIGFKPKGPLVADVRKRVCRFCMHQHYKRATGKVEEISEYCPLDLFSRDADRIRKALRALQRTPQNNFKVFVRSNNDDVVDVITGLGTDALPKGAAAQSKHSCRRKRMGFRHSCQSIGTENDLYMQDESDRLLPDVVELLTDVLLKLNILEDLKQIQLLDHISVDGMWHLHTLLERVQSIAKGNEQLPLGELVTMVSVTDAAAEEGNALREGSLARCLAFLEVALDEVPDMDVVEHLLSWKAMTLSQFESFYDQLLQRFQVATTLKDCSLLLCLRRSVDDDAPPPPVAPVHHHPQCLTKASSSLLLAPSKTFDHLREYEHRVDFRDMVFNCVVAIVDLDVKSHKSVDDYYRLDDKIVQHYTRTFGDKLQLDTCQED